MSRYSYGLELELVNNDSRKGLPKGFSQFSDQESDLCNSVGKFRGLCNDPTRKFVPITAELNSTPTDDYKLQSEYVKNAVEFYPEATINCRIDLHLHIGHPRFKTDLDLLKKLVTYFYHNTELWNDLMYHTFVLPDEYSVHMDARSFQNTNRKTMPEWRYNQIMSSNSIEEFLLNHQKDTSGKVNTRMTTRYPFNMFAIKDHGTIECRAFWPTLDSNEINARFELITRIVDTVVSNRNTPLQVLVKEWLEDGYDTIRSSQYPYDHFVHCAWKYASYPVVGSRYMIARWIEFCRLWKEDSSRFNVKSWYNQDWALFNKDKYRIIKFEEVESLETFDSINIYN